MTSRLNHNVRGRRGLRRRAAPWIMALSGTDDNILDIVGVGGPVADFDLSAEGAAGSAVAMVLLGSVLVPRFFECEVCAPVT